MREDSRRSFIGVLRLMDCCLLDCPLKIFKLWFSGRLVRLGTKHRDHTPTKHHTHKASQRRDETQSDTISLAEKDALYHGVCFSTTYSAFVPCRTYHSGICMSWWLANESMSATCGQFRPTETLFGGLKDSDQGVHTLQIFILVQ